MGAVGHCRGWLPWTMHEAAVAKSLLCCHGHLCHAHEKTGGCLAGHARTCKDPPDTLASTWFGWVVFANGAGRFCDLNESKEKEKEGLLPVRGLNICKANSRSAASRPCHAGMLGDLVRRIAAPATKTINKLY